MLQLHIYELVNGRKRPIDVSNHSHKEVLSRSKELLWRSDEKNKIFKEGLVSESEGVRPLWSPFHEDPLVPFASFKTTKFESK